MFAISNIIFALYGIFIVVAFIIIIYLIFRRIKIKKQEDFEQRDN